MTKTAIQIYEIYECNGREAAEESTVVIHHTCNTAVARPDVTMRPNVKKNRSPALACSTNTRTPHPTNVNRDTASDPMIRPRILRCSSNLSAGGKTRAGRWSRRYQISIFKHDTIRQLMFNCVCSKSRPIGPTLMLPLYPSKCWLEYERILSYLWSSKSQS